MRSRSDQRKRTGSVLVVFAVMVFVLLGVAGLTVDLGIALATREQMQSAADTAALEALRKRDDPVSSATRRQDASNLALLSQTLGLGPTAPGLEFSGGTDTGTPFLAGQLLTVASHPVGALYPNQRNDPTGDMVSGTFVRWGQGVEQDDYSRDDFDPQTGRNAFLVRLRRTGEPSTSGVSTSGAPFPYLFARGSLLNPSTKAQGIAVRVTAIADARPVMSVGQPNSTMTPPLIGATPFVLYQTYWDNLGLTAIPLPVECSGAIGIPTPAGYAIKLPSVITVGQAPAPSSDSPDLSRPGLKQYVPIIAPLPTPTGAKVERIIGFGTIQISNRSGTYYIRKRQSVIAWNNASTALMSPLDNTLRSDPNQLTRLFKAHLSFKEPLLAPALVR